MRRFKAAAKTRAEEIQATPKDQAARKWSLLEEDELERGANFGDWIWSDCPDEEVS